MAKQILIVDDDAGFRLAAGKILEGAGYEVCEAANPVEAQRQLARGLPDLILLDVVMPGQDGFAFSDELSHDARLGAVPIILCTIVAENAGQMMHAFESNQGLAARDVLSKADAGERLLGAVAAVLESRRPCLSQRQDLSRAPPPTSRGIHQRAAYGTSARGGVFDEIGIRP